MDIKGNFVRKRLVLALVFPVLFFLVQGRMQMDLPLNPVQDDRFTGGAVPRYMFQSKHRGYAE